MTIYLIEKTRYDLDRDNRTRTETELLDDAYFTVENEALGLAAHLNAPLLARYEAENHAEHKRCTIADAKHDHRVVEYDTLVQAGVTPSFSRPAKHEYVQRAFAAWKVSQEARGYVSYSVVDIPLATEAGLAHLYASGSIR
jgi:hypothetical protein